LNFFLNKRPILTSFQDEIKAIARAVETGAALSYGSDSDAAPALQVGKKDDKKTFMINAVRK
jgi:hypothetical protein